MICHELGHNLGLPDLYDTDSSSDGVGTHCLMGGGNWGKTSSDSYQGQTPVLMSAYCRQAIGFSDVRTAAGTGAAYALTQVSDITNTTDIVRLNTPNSQQYFLVENRQLNGFDAGLAYYLGVSAGGGLAVWHIDTSASNNDTDARRLVDLEEAASPVLDVPGTPLGRLQNYYYAGNVTRFDETTSPGSALNGGGASLVRVYNVSAGGSQMSFTADEAVSPVTSLAVDAPALSFPWPGGAAQLALRNTGNEGLVWQASSAAWCALAPTNGTLAAGATQLVAVACATNLVRAVSRSGTLTVTGANASGTPATGSPAAYALSQAALPSRATVISVR